MAGVMPGTQDAIANIFSGRIAIPSWPIFSVVFWLLFVGFSVQGALSPMAVLPADFPIICLPGDKLFQSKEVAEGFSLPLVVHAFHGNKSL